MPINQAGSTCFYSGVGASFGCQVGQIFFCEDSADPRVGSKSWYTAPPPPLFASSSLTTPIVHWHYRDKDNCDNDNDEEIIRQVWLMGRPQRDQEFSIPGFLGRDFAKSRDPGIFREGISLKLSSRDFTKIVWDPSGYPLQLINLVNFIHFGGQIIFVCKIHKTDKGLIHSILWHGARASGCLVLLATWWPKKSLPHTRESGSLSYCQIQLWSVKRHGLSK